MKKALVILCLILFCINLQAQNKPELPIAKTELIGVWQFNSKIVGNGLGENFQFFKDGRFVYWYNTDDDTRNIIKFEGSFRLNDKSLYLTIKSRTQRVGGNIEAGAAGTDEALFVYDNDVIKKIAEKNPKELDPLWIIMGAGSDSKSLSIKINNRTYFKLSSNPSKFDEKN